MLGRMRLRMRQLVLQVLHLAHSILTLVLSLGFCLLQRYNAPLRAQKILLDSLVSASSGSLQPCCQAHQQPGCLPCSDAAVA
jgi:hypothetical protein